MENSWLKNKMKNIMDNSTVVKEIDVLKDISLSLKELNAKMQLVESNTRSHGEEARHVLRKDTDKRVNVSLTLCISRIEDIDTVKQEFTCEFFLGKAFTFNPQKW